MNTCLEAFNNLTQEMWDKVLNAMKNKLDEISFLTWIKNLDPIFVNINKITLCAPSMFNKGIVEAKYFSLLKEVIKSVTSKDYELDIIVKTDKKMNLQSSESDYVSAGYKTPALNPEFTFDNFIASECNKIGLKAAEAVASRPAVLYNPFFVHGSVGTGKTHLIQAIGNYILAHNDSARIRYIRVEEFINDLIVHIKDNRYSDFISRFEYLDVLIADDLQYIEGKEMSQDELCKVLNKMIKKGKQVILAANKPPENITVLKEKFTSLFELGAAVKLENPDIKLKTEVLKRYCKSEGITLPIDIIELITGRQYAGMREFKGTINRIKAMAELSGQEINDSIVKMII